MRSFNVKRMSKAITTTALALAVCTPFVAQAQNAFERGQARVSVSAGNSRAYNDSYIQIGIGAGYYFLDGLELGLDLRSWLGGDISIHEISPSATYVFNELGSFKPYAGVLYRKTFIEDRQDLGAYGGRVGIFLQQSQNLHLRAGVAAIRYQDCQATMGSDCTDYYPEVSAGLYF